MTLLSRLWTWLTRRTESVYEPPLKPGQSTFDPPMEGSVCRNLVWGHNYKGFRKGGCLR